MKKKITVVVALGFVLAGSAAAQASALTSLASHRQQYDFAGRKMPVAAARIFSVDEETAPPILGGSFLQIIDKSMARTTPGKMRVAGNQAGRISVKGSGISTIADREIFYKPKLAPGGTGQLVAGGSISLIGGDLNTGDISTIPSSQLPYTAGNLVVFENKGSEKAMLRTGLSGLSGGTDQFFTGDSISLINARGSSTVSSSTPYTVGNITIRSAGNLVVFENDSEETMLKTSLSGLSGGTDQFFTGGSISLINAGGSSTVSSSKLPYTDGNLVFNITPELTMLETNMSTRSNISVPVFSDMPVLPAGSLDVKLTAMDPSPVPLPAAVYLLGSGMALLCIGRRRNEEV